MRQLKFLAAIATIVLVNGCHPPAKSQVMPHDTPMDSVGHPTREPPEKMQRGRMHHGHWYKEGEGPCWEVRNDHWFWNERRRECK